MIPLSPEEFQRRARACRLLLLDVDGVLSDGRIILGDAGEFKRFHAHDGLGLTLARAAGLQTGLLTGRSSTAVARRAAELHLDHLIQGRPDKAAAFADLCRDAGISPDQTCYMGDDWIDLPLLEIVGLSACPADARPEVKEVCHVVSAFPGGKGAVRELVDLLLKARGQHAELLQQYRRGMGEAASAGKGMVGSQ